MTYDISKFKFLDIHELAQLSVAAARDYCTEFVSIVPSRLEQLRDCTDIRWVDSRAPIEQSNTSFNTFCNWVDSFASWEARSKSVANETFLVLNSADAQYIEKLARSSSDDGYTPTFVGDSLITDVGVAIAEYFRVRFLWARWGFDKRKSSLGYAQPCVGWFGGRLNHSILVRQHGYVPMAKAHDIGCSLSQTLIRSIQYHSHIATTPGALVTWN